MDMIVGFEDLAVQCIIGHLSFERDKEQTLLIDLSVRVNVDAVAETDSLEDAFDYRLLASIVEKLARENAYHLIETLAAACLKAVLVNPMVQWGRICVKKPGALKGAKYAFAELELERKGSSH